MQELEKILEELKEATRQEDAPIYCGDMEVDGYVRVSAVENIIRKHMSDGWISCEERMPEESLNSVIGLDDYQECCCFVQYLGGRFILGNGDEPVKITAWRPLPEPYRPEKGAEE